MHNQRKGEVLAGRLRILEPLGQGAMSAVFLVEDMDLPGALWAVKEFREGSVPENEREMTRNLFQREGEIQASLSHPGLPRVLGRFSEPGGRHYLVMERIPGVPLDNLLAGRSQPLHPREALPIALQATHVLDYLHRQDPPIVFRDLKPSNLMVSPQGRVRFIDFGIARYHRPSAAKDTQELGTPGFCAPEQYHGQSTPLSDLYSLGVTLHFTLTLQDPQAFHFQFPPVSVFQSVPPLLDGILARCLQLRPQARYGSATELRQDLQTALRQAPPRKPGSTQALAGPLFELAQHVDRVPFSEHRALWRFWKEWLARTFRPGSARPARRP